MRHGSLFSGIGGFELAAEWAGWDNVFHCEIEEFPRKVLNYYWPKSICYDDITKTDFTVHRGDIDILTGGFPCQPYSAAGKRLGTEDDRHLWPEMLRAIREIKPRWVVGENVSGLISWSDGLVFEEVQTDLETEGYDVQAFVLPAASVGAPHRRDRVWFVAHNTSERLERRTGKGIQRRSARFTHQGDDGATPDTGDKGLQGGAFNGSAGSGREKRDEQPARCVRPGWDNFPTQPPVCSRNDGIPSRVDGITFPKWKNESIKAYGNAIVPQVAFQIFKAINDYEIRTG
jgi:DNA (cytosine-5)-methyltransferase 1